VGEVIDPAVIFVYITWPWGHFRVPKVVPYYYLNHKTVQTHEPENSLSYLQQHSPICHWTPTPRTYSHNRASI